MKRAFITLLAILSGWCSKSHGQLNSLYTLYVASFDSLSGFCYYNPNTLAPGEAFEIYQTFAGDVNNNLVLVDHRVDSLLHLHHYYYQQTYKGLRVEAAVFKEHADVTNEYLIYAHGMLAPGMDADPTPTADEGEAMGQILAYYSDNIFAWMDDDWEAQIKEDMDDASATHYPEGELLWALDTYADLPYVIPAERYALAWKFDVFSVTPYFHRSILVDAHTGAILREDDLDCANGTGLTYFHGTQPIDTRWTGSINKYILWADDNGRNINTRQDYNIGLWGLATNYNNPDTSWGSGDLEGTSTHWFASESWDFFASAPYNLDVFNAFDQEELRVWADVNALLTGSYSYKGSNNQFIVMDRDEEQAIDVVGHEFTHRIQESGDQTLWLVNSQESGALRESFADIFGELIENRTEHAIDWIHGDDPGNIDTRTFDVPGSDYYHFETGDESDCNAAKGAHVGQPDTYEGDNWYTGTCDNGGIHGNCGVQNLWFYVLAEGGSGINDLSASYAVSGIGLADAAQIAYYNMTVNLTNGDGFWQAREGAIQAARLLYGLCSDQEIQTTNAWHAVGVGWRSLCPPLGIPAQGEISSITVFPNPSNSLFTVAFDRPGNRRLTISTVWGSTVQELDLKGNTEHSIDLEGHPSGIYIVQVQEKGNSSFLKLVKQ